MSILLINPYYSQTEENYSFYPPTPPLGLMYIASYLRKHNVPSKIYEFGVFSIHNASRAGKRIRFGISDDEIKNIILNETGCDTLYFTKEELSSLQKKAYRSFMLHSILKYTTNPLKILRKIRSGLAYILRITFRVLGIYFRTLNPINRKSSDYLYAESKEAVYKNT